MSANQVHPVPLRMPPDLKEWIRSLAFAHDRSLNAEIVAILQQAREQHQQQVA